MGFAKLQSNELDVQKIRLYNKDSGKVPTLFESASKYVRNKGLEFPLYDAPLVDDEKSVDKVWMEWTVGGCHTKDVPLIRIIAANPSLAPTNYNYFKKRRQGRFLVYAVVIRRRAWRSTRAC